MNRRDYWKALAGWMLVLPGVTRNCEWFGGVEKSFVAEGREVRLTIDDGPDPRQTPHILEALAAAGVTATFFVIGRKAEAHPHLCRQMATAGHSVQNHTHTHPSATFWASGLERAREQIRRCSAAIEDATGKPPGEFRAPVGMANPFVHMAAREAGLRMSGWSASGHDGICHDPARVVERIRRRVFPGAILLLHESHLPAMAHGERACTLSTLLNTLRDDGYHFENKRDAPTG
ncbi:MAG: polysaccharide deacetylase family protein [Terrimicrobiaceae bacterium]